MGFIVIRAIAWFANIIELMLIGRAILSWIVNSGNQTVYRAYMFLGSLTEIVVAPCRLLLQKLNINTGMFDFSVLLALILVQAIEGILIRLAYIIFF